MADDAIALVPKRFLFFTRSPDGKEAAAAYMARLGERTEDRVKPTSPRGVAAQVVANGEDDRMLATRASFDLAHRLPNASPRIYPDAGHGGVFQCHEQFVPHVLAFLS